MNGIPANVITIPERQQMETGLAELADGDVEKYFNFAELWTKAKIVAVVGIALIVTNLLG